MKKKKRSWKFSKKSIWMAIAVVLICVAVSVAMIPLIRLLSSEAGQQLIVQKMESFGIFAPLLFVLLQVIQVVIAVIPGGPVPIIGGVLFGEWGALALCLAGFFLGTVLVYYLVQWVGKPLVDRFVSEKHFQKFDFLKNGKRLELIVFLVFLLPGLPKDALTYLVSFDSEIKPLHLFLLTTLGRAPTTALTIFAWKNLWDGNYKMALIFLAAMIVLCAAGFVVKKKIDARAKRRAEKEKKYE